MDRNFDDQPKARKDARIDCDDVTAVVQLEGELQSWEADVADVSLGGAFLGTQRWISPGSAMEVTLRFPDVGEVKLHALVVRTVPSTGGAAAGLGIRFTDGPETPELAALEGALIPRLDVLGDIDVEVVEGPSVFSVGELQTRSIYARLGIPADAPAALLALRLEEFISSIDRAAKNTAGQTQRARLAVAARTLRRLQPLFSDAEKRAAYDFGHGHLRIDARIAEAQAGTGPSLAQLHSAWQRAFPQRTRRGKRRIVEATRIGSTEDAARMLREGREDDPFNPRGFEFEAELAALSPPAVADADIDVAFASVAGKAALALTPPASAPKPPVASSPANPLRSPLQDPPATALFPTPAPSRPAPSHPAVSTAKPALSDAAPASANPPSVRPTPMASALPELSLAPTAENPFQDPTPSKSPHSPLPSTDPFHALASPGAVTPSPPATDPTADPAADAFFGASNSTEAPTLEPMAESGVSAPVHASGPPTASEAAPVVMEPPAEAAAQPGTAEGPRADAVLPGDATGGSAEPTASGQPQPDELESQIAAADGATVEPLEGWSGLLRTALAAAAVGALIGLAVAAVAPPPPLPVDDKVRNASLMLSADDPLRAVAELERLAKEHASAPLVWRQLASAQAALGLEPAARESFKRYLELAPDSADAARVRAALEAR